MRWVASLALALGLLAGAEARADEAVSERARLYFKNGVDLLQSTPPNYQDAYHQFRLAYEESKSWKVLGNLGFTALKLERDGEAYDCYQRYLEQGGNEIDPGERAALEREMLLITGNSAVVTITSSEPRLEILDTRAGSNVPPQPYVFDGGELSLRLRAGTHTITATAPDGRQLTWKAVISPGKELSYTFDFDATPTASEPDSASADAGVERVDPAQRTRGGTLRTVGFVTAGVGGAALIGGIVTGLMAKSTEQDALDTCYPVPGQEKQQCAAWAESELEKAERLALTTNILLIGGGVLAAAGVSLIVFGGPETVGTTEVTTARRPSFEITPVLTPGSAGLYGFGTF
ncbi:MAG TPA: hypothetical protein VKY73_14060 [Polyangiaceae bacterium]|nr:hypothetical protein [Polyangiaceae bacterium]